jgi:hypothetical protein
MAVTARTYIRVGWIEFGTFTLNPASIAAASQGTETVTIAGAKTGDQIFVNPQALENRIAVVGAKITSADTATLYINNMHDATTAVDGGSKTYDYILVHLS